MIDHVRPAQLSAWFAAAPEGSQPLVLDVREPWELQTASVRADGFELVAIPMGELPGRLAELDPARPIACLCHHGARSLRVAAFLQHNGFERLPNNTGGIEAWSQQIDPSVERMGRLLEDLLQMIQQKVILIYCTAFLHSYLQ